VKGRMDRERGKGREGSRLRHGGNSWERWDESLSTHITAGMTQVSHMSIEEIKKKSPFSRPGP
jgi:hypothetical protein